MQDETPENFPEGLFAGSQFPGCGRICGQRPGTKRRRQPDLDDLAAHGQRSGICLYPGNDLFRLHGRPIANELANRAQQLTNNTAYVDPYGRIPGISFTGGALQGFAYGSTPYFERNLDRTLFDNYSVTLGRHTLRAGATVSQMLKTENASSGVANFLVYQLPEFPSGQCSQYSQNSRDTIPDLHYWNFEAYGQDDWKLTRSADSQSWGYVTAISHRRPMS